MTNVWPHVPLRVPTSWQRLVALQLAVAAVVIAAFLLIEWALYADASRGSIAWLHLARGATVGVAVTVLAAVYARHEVERSAQLERRWFSFLDGLPVAAFALDGQGEPMFANQAALDLLGKGIVPVRTDELNQAYPAFVAGTDTPYPPERMPVVRALAGERTMASDMEIERDGVRTPIEVWGAPITDEGSVVQAIAVFFDISARRRLEVEQQARQREEMARRQAQHEREAQARFINHAAHQLYTPLTPLKLQLRSLAKQTDADIGPMQRSVDRIHALISQILQVAQAGTRANAIEPHPHPAKALFEHAALRLHGLAEERAVDVRVDAPDVVHGDEDLLLDALVNLVHNAIKFSPEGAEVRLTSHQDGDAVVLRVEDDGRGWTPGDEARWFEPFVQGADVVDKDASWGLGLYVARDLVQAHGGTITAHSDGPGRGAVFEIRLPTP